MTRIIASREVLSQQADMDGCYGVAAGWTYFYAMSGPGAPLVGEVRPVQDGARHGWQGHTQDGITMPMRSSRLRAAQDVLDHHTGDCTCTEDGWECCFGKPPADLAEVVASEQAYRAEHWNASTKPKRKRK